MFCGCATTPKVVYPNVTNFINSTDFKKYKKLAVLSFTDAPYAPYSGQIVQGLASQAFGKFGFDIVERGRLSEVLGEQYLSLTGVISKKDSMKLGEVLGVKALVLGEVGQYETADRKTDTTYFPLALGGQTSYIPIQGQQWKESYVSISLRVVDVETGQLVYSGSGQYNVGISNPPQEAATHIVYAIVDKWVSSPGRCGFQYDKNMIIIDVLPYSPAKKAKLKIGDKILELNGKNIKNLLNEDLHSLAWGYPGENLSMKVQRGDKIISVDMIRVPKENLERQQR